MRVLNPWRPTTEKRKGWGKPHPMYPGKPLARRSVGALLRHLSCRPSVAPLVPWRQQQSSGRHT